MPSGEALLDQLRVLRDVLRPVLYYSTSEAVPRGQVLYHEGAPRFMLIHPDDLDGFMQLSAWRLVPLCDAPILASDTDA
jgi:hypothetical protein